MNQTICAIATATGGAIGLVRVSGERALEITQSIFRPVKAGKQLTECKPYTITFGHIMDGEEVVDEVLVSVFRAPHSYTGEDSAEITCHGSSYILQRILQLLLDHGCRMAAPGEYTQRAFLNGKMDLSQAEAVADVIASDSAATHRMAMNQMRGGFSRELTVLTDSLLHFTTLIELELDFSDHEELEFADRGELRALAGQIADMISGLVKSFRVGNALKHGLPVAIIGETNAGKSTLLNALLHEEKAIVSNIHGTTRDSIEDTILIDGITFRFIDTAGIRSTTDTIESMGIERTFQKTDQADMVLWVISAECAHAQIMELAPKVLPHCRDKKLIAVINKSDLAQVSPIDVTRWLQESLEGSGQNWESSGLTELYGTARPSKPIGSSELNGPYESSDSNKTVRISEPFELSDLCEFHTISIQAKHGQGLDDLEQLLVRYAQIPAVTQNQLIVTNARHYQALCHALDSIHRVQEGLESGISGDFISQDIRECIHHLGEINLSQQLAPEHVLGNIFKHFCIGK